MEVIYPTVGRVVHYVPAPHEYKELAAGPGDVLAAHVATVWDERTVNLMVIDGNGNPHSRTSVFLDQPGDPEQPEAPYCKWMPYQVGQAAKTEEMAKQLEGGA